MMKGMKNMTRREGKKGKVYRPQVIPLLGMWAAAGYELSDNLTKAEGGRVRTRAYFSYPSIT